MRLLRPAPFPLVPPGLPLLVGGAAVAAAAAAPVGGYLSVMGAPVYGQGLLPGTGGLLDFDTLSPRVSTNEYLVAPPDRCLDFVASETGGGGGGARRGGDAPQYDVPVDELQRTFLAMVEELYILKEYAQPTTASKPDERRFVIVQRTPLLRFPDVINVAFLALPSPQLEEEGVEFDLSAGRSTLIIHSGSVFGFDDIGKNRERVTEWLQRLDDAIASKVSSSSSSALTTEVTEAEETIMEAEETMMEAEDAEVVAGEDEDEVAAVIGHEIAHVAFRHSNKRMSQAMGIALGGVILNTAMRNKSSTDRVLATGAYGVGSTVGMALPFSRSQEREADHRGLFYAAMAGYDPRGAISFWKKMQGGKKRKLPEFLSTHPNPGNRIEFLEANMEHALGLYREAKLARGEQPNP